MKMEDLICFIGGVFGSLVTALFGDFSVSVKVMLLFMGFNIISGAIRAIHQKSAKSKHGGLSADAMLKGLSVKVMMMILLSAAHWSDILLEINYVKNCVGYALIAHELLSILQNYTIVAGNPPKVFEKVIDIIQDMNEDMEEKNHD